MKPELKLREQHKSKMKAELKRFKGKASGEYSNLLIDTETVKPFVHLDGMQDIPHDAAIKKLCMSDEFFVHDEDVFYCSEIALEHAAKKKDAGEPNVYFSKAPLGRHRFVQYLCQE